MAANEFTMVRESMSIITCHDEKKTKKTLSKVWNSLAFLDNNTQGGMSRTKLIKNTELEKTAGLFKLINGVKVPSGWRSTIQGIVADDPLKIRGDRADILIYDEAGSWPGLLKAVIQGEALLLIGGVKFGIAVIGGTGGDKGPNLEGLRGIYYNPQAYSVLPFKHNYTASSEVVETAFFIPAYAQVFNKLDSRGWCDPVECKALLLKLRDKMLNDPNGYLAHCAEYCWTAEEAFALEGDNKFNKRLVAELMANIRLHKIGPRPVAGDLFYLFEGKVHDLLHVCGFTWKPNKSSALQILEHPIWSEEYMELLDDEAMSYEEMNDLYIAGVDGIDIGKNQTSSSTKDASDFCIIIYKRPFGTQPPLIVAIYKDRPQEITTAYKIALSLIKYYNARVNVEATRIGFLNWAKNLGLLGYFMRRPRATLSDIRSGNTKSYGTPATVAIINMQTDLIATWLEDYWEGIWFIEVLEELERYNDEDKRKFDIIAALGMVMLADQELSARVPKKKEGMTADEFPDFGYWTDERGYKHYGIIPSNEDETVLFGGGDYDDPYRVESSDTRYYQLPLGR